jgi:hypothetical protein
MKKDPAEEQPQKGQAAELLGQWRGAERDLVAARTAADVASAALGAAKAAEDAAAATKDAAQAAAEAVERALKAAATAKRAAEAAAAAARLASAGAEGDQVRASHDVEVAEEVEHAAGQRFRDARDRGFTKEPDKGG